MSNSFPNAPSLVDLYKSLYLIRSFELHVERAVRGTDIARFVHLAVGQEAVAVGVCAVLAATDKLAVTYRGHGYALARGMAPQALLGEILGRTAGRFGGRAGSMHSAADPALGIIDATAVVGANIPIGTGSALASVLLAESAVTACVFGDGAVGEGAFHEALNVGALWRLPVVYICENNGYAMSTPFGVTSPVATVVQRAAGYGIPAEAVDGNDVLAVWRAAQEAICRARDGAGPSLLEMRTQLLRGHYVGQQPRSDAIRRDPVQAARDRLVADGLSTEVEAIEHQVELRLVEALTAAEASPYPATESLLVGNYAEEGHNLD